MIKRTALEDFVLEDSVEEDDERAPTTEALSNVGVPFQKEVRRRMLSEGGDIRIFFCVFFFLFSFLGTVVAY